jgi:phage tail-like protein
VPRETNDTNRPRPKFSFAVDIAGVGARLHFQEVSGLDVESQPVEYRRGSTKTFSTIKMPGMHKAGNVTLKRGVFAKDNTFFDWLDGIKRNAVKPSTVTIKLLDENGNPTMTWTLLNARPAKITAADFNADGNDVAIDTLELTHDGLTIDNK